MRGKSASPTLLLSQPFAKTRRPARMLVRWLLALGVGLGTAAAAVAQVAQIAPPDCLCPDHPVELPPLLTPPVGDPNAPRPAGPRGPTGEYDHGYLYLPESAPPAASGPEQCRPL